MGQISQQYTFSDNTTAYGSQVQSVFAQLFSLQNGNIDTHNMASWVLPVNVKDDRYGAKGDGTTDDSTALTKAAAAANGGDIYLPPGTYRISNNITIAYGNRLIFSDGAVLAPDNGVAVAINCEIVAGLYKIFGGSGTVSGKIVSKEVYPNWWGADPTGANDSTQAVQNAYNAVVSAGGGILFFPVGTFKFNLSVTASNVLIVGAGRFATQFKPASLTTPVLHVGDGTASTQFITLAHFSMTGDGSTATSDGIVVTSTYYLNVLDVEVDSFGNDNIRLESSSTRATSYVNFTQVDSRFARGSCFKAVYGSQWVTAVNFANCSLNAYNTTGSYALYLNGVKINTANTWIQCGGGTVGNVYLTGSNAGIHGWGTTVDSNSSSDVLVIINSVASTSGPVLLGYLEGDISVDGLVQWSDGVQTGPYTGYSSLPYEARMSYALVEDCLLFGQQEAAGSSLNNKEVPNTSGPRLSRKGANPNETLQVLSSAFRPLGTYSYPLQFSANGALWRNGTTGYLRYAPASWWPSSDTYAGSGNLAWGAGATSEKSITNITAQTPIVTYTPPSNGNFMVGGYLRNTTSSAINVTVQLVFTDASGTVQTQTIPSVTSVPANGGVSIPFELINSNVSAITLQMQPSATGIMASGSIVAL